MSSPTSVTGAPLETTSENTAAQAVIPTNTATAATAAMSLSYISTVTTPRRVGRRRSISISGDAITPDAAETVHGHRRIVSDTLVHGRVYDTGNNATTSKANTSKEIDVSAQPWFDRSAFPGHSGQFYDEDRVFTIDNSLRESLLTKPMPTGEDLLRFGLFLCPDCIGVVWLMGFVTVELPHTDEVTFATRLSNTPQTYDNSPCEILYHNGLVTLEELARKKRPTPKLSVTERVEDDTDYVEQQGLLRPGCMISSIKDDGTTSEATAGIIVERNGEQRLTCSWHVWEELANTNKTVTLGDDTPASRKLFRAYSGNTRSPIGHVVERVGKTDIALMKLDDGVKFQNVFFNGHKPRRLIHHHHLSLGHDKLEADGFTTGVQSFICWGARVQGKREPSAPHPIIDIPPEKDHFLPIPGAAYVECDQGIYSVDEDVMFSPPYMRRRAVGAVLVRHNMWIKDEERFLGIKATRARGEVVAMLHLSDLKHRFDTSGRVWIYADSFSPLIKAGWTVVATPPDVALDNVQALFEDDGEDDGEEDDDEQSSKPTKKGTEEVQQNEGPQESPKKRKGKPDHRRDVNGESPKKRRAV